MTWRPFLIALAALLAIFTYPVVWALGYQDHPWHLHTAADVVAFGALLASTFVHVGGTRTVPPVPRWLTWIAVLVSSGAFASALFWDEMGRPKDVDVRGGFGWVLWLLLGIAAASAVGLILRHAAPRKRRPRRSDLGA